MSNRNSKKDRKSGGSAQPRNRNTYKNAYNRKRLIASLLAILLALAMIFAYVIEVREFAKPAAQPESGPEGSVVEEAQTQPLEEAPPSAEEDAANAQAAAELAAESPAEAAAHLAEIGDLTVYENTLRAILNDRYESGASNEDLAPFTTQLDERGAAIAHRYANAYDDRQRGYDNGYIPAQILLMKDPEAADADSAGEQELRGEVADTMGEISDFLTAGDMLIGVVDLSLEWSVPDAVESFEGSGYHAQPDYLYDIQNEDDAVREETGADGETDGNSGSDSPAEETPLPVQEDPAPSQTVEEPAPVQVTEDSAPARNAEEPAIAKTAEAPSDLNKLFDGSPARLPLTDCWNLLAANHQTVRIGVLDTGVYSAHEDLDDVLATDSEGTLLSGDYTNGSVVPGAVTEKDNVSHGTHVCGIIAAEANGTGMAGVTAGYSSTRDPETAGGTITPVSELIVVSGYVYFTSQTSWGFSSSSITKGINYLAEQDCRIINLSLGGTTAYDDLPVMGAIDNAVDKGILLVIAAGNKDGSAIPPYISYPGWYPGAISVINAQTAYKRYTTSNYGPDYDIAAPGYQLNSTTHTAQTDEEGNPVIGEDGQPIYIDYSKKTGTSMAAPVITGIAAMMLYEDPSLTPREIKNILYATAGNQLSGSAQPAAGTVNTASSFQGGMENTGNQLGFGYVDPVAAITAVQQRANGAQRYADYLELNRTLIEDLEVGNRTTLEYRLLPATAGIPDTENGSGIVWTSSDPAIATVSSDGIITAVSDGTCTITGTCPGAGAGGTDVSAAVTVTINTINLNKEGAVISGMEDKLHTGSAIEQDIQVTLENGTVLTPGTDYTVSYQNNIAPGTATVTVKGTGHYYGTITGTFTILPRQGWKLEDGIWHYYKTDGSLLTNGWARKSTAWCYLDSTGRMVCNGWIKDSKGYCWMNSSGYWEQGTKWIKSGSSWYHITNGYRDAGKWMKDSKGWCYLGSDGRMITNGWAKDSVGWCWMGADGYWTSNKWIKDKGEWYYIKPNHYMAANEWAKDSRGWMWMAGSGKITKSKWIKYRSDWYYLKSDGYMATGTYKIGGKVYRFASSGKWIP